MSASQLVYFSSSDASGPGLISGTAGSLLTIFDACLVNGYSGHILTAQWTKPFVNSGNIGCYKQGAGAGLSLLVNDNGPNATSTYEEAWAIGWESIAGIGAPVGTGSGQFPTPTQLLTTGHTVWRKSVAASSATRSWQMFADSSTFYLFISTGDTVGTYYPAMFGDVFSLKGSSDAYRRLIIGRAAENSATQGVLGSSSTPYGTDQFDAMVAANYNSAQSAVSAYNCGHYMARTWGGGGTSINVGKIFDVAKAAYRSDANTYTWTTVYMAGALQIPNGPDNSLYLTPVSIVEPVTGTIRGRLRGIYQVCHPVASFSDGQTFSGGGDYAGKTFQIIKQMVNGGFLAMETSATVETN